MTTTVQTQISEAVRAAGASPRLQRSRIDATVPPSLGSEGYDVLSAARADVRVVMGSASPRRRYVLSASSFDATSTYEVDIGGGTYTVTEATPTDEDELWTDLAAGLVSALAGTGSAVTADLAAGTLTLDLPIGLGAVTWSETGGAADIEMVTDAATCRATIYGRLEASAGQSYIESDDDDYPAIYGWAVLATTDGGVHDYDVTSDGLDVPALWVRAVGSVRVWLRDVAGLTGDACTAGGSGTGTLTVRDPWAVVLPCVEGVS